MPGNGSSQGMQREQENEWRSDPVLHKLNLQAGLFGVKLAALA